MFIRAKTIINYAKHIHYAKHVQYAKHVHYAKRVHYAMRTANKHGTNDAFKSYAGEYFNVFY